MWKGLPGLGAAGVWNCYKHRQGDNRACGGRHWRDDWGPGCWGLFCVYLGSPNKLSQRWQLQTKGVLCFCLSFSCFFVCACVRAETCSGDLKCNMKASAGSFLSLGSSLCLWELLLVFSCVVASFVLLWQSLPAPPKKKSASTEQPFISGSVYLCLLFCLLWGCSSYWRFP